MTETFEVPPSVAKRTRPRRSRISVDHQDIVDRVLKFEQDDMTRKEEDIDLRNQRYAKYRMWSEGKDFPWPDSSDVALPDIAEACLRMQDTLHNAVMSQSPPFNAKDLTGNDRQKQEKIDRLIEYQFFSEQKGEDIVGTLAQSFIVDGVWRTFTPWIKEHRSIHETLLYDPIPEDMEPLDYFSTLIRQKYPEDSAIMIRAQDGWDWRVLRDDPIDVAFYTKKDGTVEMVFEHEVVVYDGPRCLPLPYEQVLYPPRCENLQIPSPSNPRGAPHVILVDFPTKDEIHKLIESGYYDLATKDDKDHLNVVSRSADHQELERTKDTLAGQEGENQPDIDQSQNTVTRLLCFDIYKGQDIVWWVIKETKTLLRARYLTEFNPSNPPKRPIDEAQVLPIEGRCEGWSYIELMEGLHDAMKIAIDQGLDAGTILNAPFFFYRPHGAMKPEILRMAPGEGYPLGDPSKDVNFPTFGNRDQAFTLNVFTLLQQLQEKTTMVGDIQQGRVPPGRSSALRTIGGVALLLGQGESRPERVLRRFFMGLSGVWKQFHALNQHFLPNEKKIRITGALKPEEDPYLEIARRAEIEGPMRFDFDANVLNTSKEALQQSLMQLGGVNFSQISFMVGTADAEGYYRWQRDVNKAFGQDPDQYLKKPSPEADMPRMLAEEALIEIMHNGMPNGAPLESGGWIEHLQKLMEFVQTDEFGLLTPDVQVPLFEQYVSKVRERAAMQQKQQAIAQAAAQQQQGQQNPTGRPPEGGPPPMGNPPVNGGELLNETLPSNRPEAK